MGRQGFRVVVSVFANAVSSSAKVNCNKEERKKQLLFSPLAQKWHYSANIHSNTKKEATCI